MSNIKENKLFDSIVDNCIVNLCKYIIELHNINPRFNHYCLDILIRYNVEYIIQLIKSSLPKLNDHLLNTFTDFIDTYKNTIGIDNIEYINKIIDIIIDTIIITLKLNHDESNNIITHYVKYATCEDVLYVCEEMLNRLD